jgi:thiol-disulfide isomerase/thioredoxin
MITLGVCTSAYAQEQTGMDFRHGSYKEVLAESKKTGKLVFIDSYTSWCAPCKWMEKNVFINDTVAEFYNKHFINYKIDMEKGEGPELRKRYGVQVFPTYLFVDSKGELVHKATSRMEVPAFIEEGKKAMDPKRSFTALEKKFEAGKMDKADLLQYALILRNINRQKGDSVSELLVTQLKDKELDSELGWKTIEAFAWSEQDRLGKYFLAHKDNYEKKFGAEGVQKLETRLTNSAMYAMIRNKDSVGFFKRLPGIQAKNTPDAQKNAVMLEAEFYQTTNNASAYVALTNKAMEGVLKNDDMALSFLARRADSGDKLFMEQAYKMAKRAVEISPEEYTTQSTLAKVCLQIGNKAEALIAGQKTYELSLQETSKIVGLAQKLLDEINKMP